MESVEFYTTVSQVKKNLKSKVKRNITMRIDDVLHTFQVSNYFAKFQNKSNDLILVENNELAFTVSIWDANFTIAEQIRNVFK